MKAAIAVPATSLLVYRAWSRNSLTPAGILVAAATATVHAIHPWSAPFAFLVVFFLGGTTVTKVKHDVKERLTLSASGASGGEGPRTHVQVLANSAVASVLILLHARQLYGRGDVDVACFQVGGDLLLVGIIANYAAVAADTFSSELGILSKGSPRLITSPTLRKVPPGTNGGVTLLGTLAGLLGAFTIAATAVLLIPFCASGSDILASKGFRESQAWTPQKNVVFVAVVTIWGGLGSLLDSFLGGWLQHSVIDVRSGKVVEGSGGQKVLVGELASTSSRSKKHAEIRAAIGRGEGNINQKRLKTEAAAARAAEDYRPPSRKVESGVGLLDNNSVNFLMALVMSVGGMLTASWVWDTPLSTIFT